MRNPIAYLSKMSRQSEVFMTIVHVFLTLTIGNTVLQVLLGTVLETASNFINLLKPTGHVMHHLFNIQQLYVLPTLYLCVLYLSENKQRLVPLTS